MIKKLTPLIEAVAEAYGITSADVLNTSTRAGVITTARKALIVSMIALGYDYRDFGLVIRQSRTMPLHYREQGMAMFRMDNNFRALLFLVFKKINEDDKYKQFSSRYPYKVIDRDEGLFSEDAYSGDDPQASESKKGSKLFDFTPEEEKRMRLAKVESVLFMHSYGRGVKHQPMVDKKKYQ